MMLVRPRSRAVFVAASSIPSARSVAMTWAPLSALEEKR